jgi:lipoprotein LpqH
MARRRRAAQQKESSVNRGFVIAVGGAALVIAGLSGCSSDSKESSATQSASSSSGTGETKLTVDGQEQQLQGTVACTSMGGNLNIGFGQATGGIGAVISEGDDPVVRSVGLGNVNGVTLAYQEGTGQGSAQVEKDDKTYTIKGDATGVDMANPMAGQITKPFELSVTCP